MQDIHKNNVEHQAPDGSRLSLFHVWSLLNEIKAKVEEIERKQNEVLTAFVVNDLNKPDLDGHRRHHLRLNKSAEIVEGYKYEMTKKVLSVIGGGMLTFIATSVWERYFGGH